MNEHIDEDDPGLARGDRELTLSTGSILGIFLGLVLLCGLCFGFGYNMGRKSLPTPLALNGSTPDSTLPNNDAPPSDTPSSGAAKPAAGSPADNASAPAATPPPVIVKPQPAAPKPAPIVRKPPAPETGEAIADTPPASSHSTSAPAAIPAASRAVPPSALLPGTGTTASGTGNAASGTGNTASGTGTIMVQVAAVSHPEDADLLVGALRSRGYAVSARKGATDGFIHVQVGPFNNKPSAEAMRQRLLADGYNAILK